ncbi:two-component response regulator [Fusarium beomiforme]|uniref:Two-component response regulator n=1 Tax=Fusarium beomiforme TaxID=44412 RepID=A0A9P5DRT0_9HYPO|nr:two-component response regulator [Fusarium beomiforme]
MSEMENKAADVSTQKAPSKPPDLESPPVEDAKYLLVDDNKVNMKLMKHHFDKLGLKYNIAWNGQEVVDIYKAHPERCRLILLDISMPVMGGMHASLLIRQHETENNLPPAVIVGVVAHLLQKDNERFVNEFGMNTTLQKPIRMASLEEIINNWPV